MIIREAVIGDLPRLMDIYNHEVLHSTATFDLEEKTWEERKVWFSKYGGKYPLLVTEYDGVVIGYGSLSQYKERRAYALTVELSVYIADEYRGQGAGRKIMNELIKRAVDSGFHTIISGITGGNLPSVKLHERFGFQRVGQLLEVGKKFGEWQNVHLYQLLLNQ